MKVFTIYVVTHKLHRKIILLVLVTLVHRRALLPQPIACFIQPLRFLSCPPPPKKKEKEEQEEMAFDGVWVMMNGLSGKMGLDVAAACLRKGFRIAPYAMSGTGSGEVKVSDLEVSGTQQHSNTAMRGIVREREREIQTVLVLLADLMPADRNAAP